MVSMPGTESTGASGTAACGRAGLRWPRIAAPGSRAAAQRIPPPRAPPLPSTVPTRAVSGSPWHPPEANDDRPGPTAGGWTRRFFTKNKSRPLNTALSLGGRGRGMRGPHLLGAATPPRLLLLPPPRTRARPGPSPGRKAFLVRHMTW